MRVLSARKLKMSDLAAFAHLAEETSVKRDIRRDLLSAFDIYKQNVVYGILDETQADRETVLRWYRALLDLDETAFSEVPPAVAAYLGGGENA